MAWVASGSSAGVIAAVAWVLTAGALASAEGALPHGRRMGVASIAEVASLLLMGAWPALGLMVVSLCISAALPTQAAARRIDLIEVLARTAALSVAVAATLLLPGIQWPAMLLVVLAHGLVHDGIVLFAPRERRPLTMSSLRSTDATFLASRVSVTLLLVLCYPVLGVWALAPVLGLSLVMGQAYATLMEIEATYSSTAAALVQSAELSRPERRGHAEFTAVVARRLAHGLGLRRAAVDRIALAAMLHATDLAASESDDGEPIRSYTILQGVEYFDRVAEILRALDGAGPAEPSGDLSIEAFVVAFALAVAESPSAMMLEKIGLERASAHVSAQAKARVVLTALRLGYRVPSIT